MCLVSANRGRIFGADRRHNALRAAVLSHKSTSNRECAWPTGFLQTVGKPADVILRSPVGKIGSTRSAIRNTQTREIGRQRCGRRYEGLIETATLMRTE